jgi:hypothetical protein
MSNNSKNRKEWRAQYIRAQLTKLYFFMTQQCLFSTHVHFFGYLDSTRPNKSSTGQKTATLQVSVTVTKVRFDTDLLGIQ